MSEMTKVAVVTGANKGIGFAIVKGLLKRFDGVVYLTSRDDGRGKAAVKQLNEIGLQPAYHQLDVTDKNSVETFRDHIKETHGGIDILVNNAAVNTALWFYSYEECKNVVDVIYYGLLLIQDILFPLLKNDGRVINISSDCGHLSNVKNKYWIDRLSSKELTLSDVNDFVSWYLDAVKNRTFRRSDMVENGALAPYRVGKVAVSALTLVQQKMLEPRNISVNSMHPGLVRTDLTSGIGFYDIDQAAETPLYLALDAPQTLKGAYVWYDKRVLDWYDYNADYYFKTKSIITNIFVSKPYLIGLLVLCIAIYYFTAY